MCELQQGTFAVSHRDPSSPVDGRALRARLWAAGQIVVLLLTLAFLRGSIGSNSAPQALAQEQPPSPGYCSKSMAITPDGRTLLVVNPDSNSLTLLDTADHSVLAELPVGVDPRSVAVSPDGLWACVACQGSDSVSFIDLTVPAVVEAIAVGDRPVGVAVSPQGDVIAIAELGDDQVRLLDAVTRSTRSVVAVHDRPHGLAFTPDGRRLLVTHLLSGDVAAITLEPWTVYLPIIIKNTLLDASQSMHHTSRITHRASRITLPTWPNIAPAPSVLVNSAGTRAYLPQTMAHGQGLNTQFDNTVFPKVSVLNLETNEHQTSEHISLPETDQPVGLPWDAALAKADTELWVVNAASNDLSVIDISAPTRPRRMAHLSLGANPRGVLLHPHGHTAYVNNALDGTVSVIDTQAYTITSVVAVTQIPLPPVLLQGKRLFHSSATPELAQARWISCNTCHIEGEHDGRTWLLQYSGEVPPGASPVITRNTTSLLGMVETYPLRWSAEWDESADSEFSIRFEQFGTGLIDGDMHPTLGSPNQGRSWDLDSLAAFVDSLQVPERDAQLSDAEQRGAALFRSPSTGCLTCHPAPLYTDLKQHDVGTASAFGEWFGPLIDTPTLRFLYDSAPYLHDGSATTLHDVLTTPSPNDPHGMTSVLSQQEVDDLEAFLLALPHSSEEGGFTYQASSCLGEPGRAAGRIEIWVEGCDIVMVHHDAVYNCCAQMVIYLEDQRPLLKLIEQEEYPDSEPCRCQCTYELGARIANLPPGTYVVQVWNGAAEQLLAEQRVTVRRSE